MLHCRALGTAVYMAAAVRRVLSVTRRRNARLWQNGTDLRSYNTLLCTRRHIYSTFKRLQYVLISYQSASPPFCRYSSERKRRGHAMSPRLSDWTRRLSWFFQPRRTTAAVDNDRRKCITATVWSGGGTRIIQLVQLVKIATLAERVKIFIFTQGKCHARGDKAAQSVVITRSPLQNFAHVRDVRRSQDFFSNLARVSNTANTTVL